MSAARETGAAPWSEHCVDAACLVFACFTVCCHAVVAAGGSLHVLVIVFPLALVALWAGLRRLPVSGAELPVSTPASEVSPVPRVIAIAIGAAAFAWLPADVVSRWWCAVVLLGAGALWVVATQPPRLESAVRGASLEWGLWGLALVAAVLALVFHRFDLDDAFYVNLAVAIADAPDAPLLAGDTLHGIVGLPLHLPVYRTHSYEVWNAALAWASGVPALLCFHVVSAAIAAALVPLAAARLARRLLPAHWLFLTVAVMVVLLASGDAHRSPGNFAFVRIWQGKSIALAVFLPLVAAAALDFVARPGAKRFVWLVGAQIAALGCTSSAAWLAPATALAAGAAVAPVSRRGLMRLALVALSTVYLLGAGWQMQQAIAADESSASAERALIEDGPRDSAPPGARLEIAFAQVLGQARLPAVTWGAVWIAWALLPAGVGRRFASVVPLAVLVVILNPYTSDAVLRHVTGYSYWRGLWALPIPWLLALAIAAPLGAAAGRARLVGAAASVATLLAFATAVPERSTLSAENGVAFGAPGRKVQEIPYAHAAALTAALPAGAPVIAPRSVGLWLVTFHDRLHPFVVRPAYLQRYRDQLGEDEVALRLELTHFVEGRDVGQDAARRFALALERYGIRGVVLEGFPEEDPARRVLRRAGFEPIRRSDGYETWVRA